MEVPELVEIQETGGRIQETGDRIQEAEYRRQNRRSVQVLAPRVEPTRFMFSG
jgi:hypothetical protein